MSRFRRGIYAAVLGIAMTMFSSTGILKAQSSSSLTPTPGEFPLVALTVFNKETGPKEGDLRAVKECGFNLCLEESTADRYEVLLKYMEGTGLKLIPHTYWFSPEYKGSDWKQKIKAFVDKFKGSPLIAGWDFGDEPKWDTLDEMAVRYAYLKNLDPGRFVSYNLVGQMAKAFTGPCKTLPAYLDSIEKRFKMDAWSSDYYPIVVKKGKLDVNYKGFYTNLETFSRKSKETGIPMWTYCASIEYVTESQTIPAATVPYLSFEAFSALGYGAQGIVYWSYWNRASGAKYKMVSALVDLDGNKSPAWYAAQKVNHQIKALTPVFLGAELVECRHTGMIKVEGTYPYISNFGPLDELTNDVKGVQVSHLKNNGHDYLVLVNHDVEKKQKVKMKFRKNLNVTQLKASDTGVLSSGKVKSNCNVTLSPGGYAVFEWK